MTTKRAKRSTDASVVTLDLVPDGGDRLPPQMKEILFCLDDNGGEQTIGDLMVLLEKVLSTKQSAKKVWKYYKKRMVEDNWITIK
jgi:hypothetical protein